MSNAVVYGRITRATELEDGTVYVEGVASTEARDTQPSSMARFGKGQIVRASAMRAAIPEYMQWGPVREMHQPIAAGKAAWMEVRDDNCTYMGARVVDPSSCKKVLTDVLKAFSINGTALERNAEDPSIIEKLVLSEVSLVDAPGDPGVQRFSIIRFAEGASMDPAKTATATQSEPAVAPAVAPPAASAAPAKPHVQPTDESKAPAVVAQAPTPPAAGGESPETVSAAQQLNDVTRASEAPATAPAPAAQPVTPAAPDQITRVAELETRITALEDGISRAGEALRTVLTERDELVKRAAEMEALLAQKGVTKIIAVDKADDTGGAVVTRAAEQPQAQTPTNTVDAIRRVHAAGPTVRLVQ